MQWTYKESLESVRPCRNCRLIKMEHTNFLAVIRQL